MLQKITASGCLAARPRDSTQEQLEVSSVIAAFVAAKPDGFTDAEAALYGRPEMHFLKLTEYKTHIIIEFNIYYIIYLLYIIYIFFVIF